MLGGDAVVACSFGSSVCAAIAVSIAMPANEILNQQGPTAGVPDTGHNPDDVAGPGYQFPDVPGIEGPPTPP